MKTIKAIIFIAIIIASYFIGMFFPASMLLEEQVTVINEIQLPENHFFNKQENYTPNFYGTINPGTKCIKYLQKANVYYVKCGFVTNGSYFESK